MSASDVLKLSLVMLLWAVCFPLITLGIQDAPHISFAALRAVIAGVTLLALAAFLGRPFPRGLRLWMSLLAIGVGATTFGFLGMFHAAEFVQPGAATVIANTQPLVTAVLASIFLAERSRARVKIGLGIGFAGVVIIAAPALMDESQPNYAIGISYILLAALGVACSNLLIKRIAHQIDAIMAMAVQLLLGAIPLGIWAVTTEDADSITWSMQFVFSLTSLSLLGTALVYCLWFRLIARLPLSRANAFSFLVPVIGLAMGTSFFGETIEWPHLVGLTLTLLGVAMVVRADAPPTPGASNKMSSTSPCERGHAPKIRQEIQNS